LEAKSDSGIVEGLKLVIRRGTQKGPRGSRQKERYRIKEPDTDFEHRYRFRIREKSKQKEAGWSTEPN